MLLFSDRPKQIRVLRVSPQEGTAAREVLGYLPKATLALSDELRTALDGDELIQVENVVEVCRKSEALRLEINALNFPAAAREAMDYFETSADETEQQLIASALVDAIRRLRKHERATGVKS